MTAYIWDLDGTLLDSYGVIVAAARGTAAAAGLDDPEEHVLRARRAGADHFVYTHRGGSSGPILRRLGILDCFREVVTSAYGFSPKPSGDGVRYLLEKYGLDPGRTWYVGDRQLDVFCAKDAGVKALLYLPPGACVAATGREDRIVRDRGEI